MSAQSNPFRIDDKPGEDTRHVVRSVLMFMANAFEAMENSEEIWLDGASVGASIILGACAGALKEAEKKEGSDEINARS